MRLGTLSSIALGACSILFVFALAAPSSAQNCIKCNEMKTGCMGSGNYCCCDPQCSYSEGPPPTVTCNCTNFCQKCGQCPQWSCQTCVENINNGLEGRPTQLVSLALPQRLADSPCPQCNGHGRFLYTPEAMQSLQKKSPIAAAILDGLTSRCGAPKRERVPLSAVKDAEFSGGSTTTFIEHPLRAEAVDWEGTLTVVDRKAILNIVLTPIDRALTPWASSRPLGKPKRLHVEVSEEGAASVTEQELPSVRK
jgi:hypothetical protein